MDADPEICLYFLYQNDPFYSFCLSDLMTAPQQVKNKFLKEQKNLTMTVKKLEHQKLTRLRQLNEEINQFGLLMQKKLAPRVTVRREPSMAAERGSPRTLSSVTFYSLLSSKSSWRSLSAKPCIGPGTDFPSSAGPKRSVTRTPNVCKTSDPSCPDVVPAKYLRAKQQLTRSENFLPVLSRTKPPRNLPRNISKRN